MDDVIKVNSLNVLQKDKSILEGISIEVAQGGVYALLGREVRLKRLLLKIISSMGLRLGAGGNHLRTAKTLYVDNDSVAANMEIAEGVCYVMQGKILFSFMTAEEYIHYSLAGSGMNGAEIRGRAGGALELTGLLPKREVKLKKLSPAEHKLLNAAVQLCRDAAAVIINADELVYDKREAERLDAALKNLKACGKAVLISFSDARFVGDSVDTAGVFSNGRIVMTGTPEQLIGINAASVYTVKPGGNIALLAEKLKELAKDYKVKVAGGKLHIHTNRGDASKKLVEVFAQNGAGIEDLRVKTPTLQAAVNKAAAK